MGPAAEIALDTLRTAGRRPLALSAAALGCLALWAGAGLEVLGLGRGSRALVLAVGTAEAIGLLLGVVLAVRLVGEDEASGVGEALDAARAGTGSRLTGRFLGVWGVALLAGLPVLLLGAALLCAAGEGPAPATGWPAALALEVAAAGAWAVLLARTLPPGAATLAALVVAVATRLGDAGPLAALFPQGVRTSGRVDATTLLAQTSVVVAALLAATAAPGRARA
jgi:hypothetical protein